MTYPIEALNTEAQCDEVIQHLQPLRSALNHQKENKVQIELFLSNASITLEANITAAITEKKIIRSFHSLTTCWKNEGILRTAPKASVGKA